MPFDPLLVRHMTRQDNYSFGTGYKLTRELLEEGMTLPLCIQPRIPLLSAACRALKEAGKRVPEDISVAGFDGIDVGEYYIPSITTIRQPVEAMATESARKLFAMIDRKEEPSAQVFDGELVIRESTGKPKE